ncbi:MAG: FAD-dependent oxidoreductase, partial [Clostridia bacterium]|nr:FAD-dependent oxidoreductase [Clostridia bacterium]
GVKHRMLGLENEEELIGSGLSFCAVCDGAFYAGQDVAMVGGGNSALQEALLLSEICKSVTVIQNLPAFTGEKKLADALMEKSNVHVHFSTIVTAYQVNNGALTGLTLRKENGEETLLPVDGAFLAVGLVPENDAFQSFAKLNSWGYFDAAEDCATKTPGLFVAGDCRAKGIRQVVTAASDGAIAAMAACRYLD